MVGVHVAHPDVAEVGRVDGLAERRDEWLAERGGAGIDEDRLAAWTTKALR